MSLATKTVLSLTAVAGLALAIALAFFCDERQVSTEVASRAVTPLPSRSVPATTHRGDPPGIVSSASAAAALPPSTTTVINRIADVLRDLALAPDAAAREDLFNRILPPLIERLAVEHPTVSASDFATSPEIALRLDAQIHAARDFAGTYRDTLRIADAAQRTSILASALYQSELRAPQSTLELAQSAPLGESREAVLQNLAAQWAEADSPAVIAWAMAEPATPSRDGIFQRLATACAAADPAQAAHLLAFGISPGPTQEETVAQILAHWPASHPADASAWVQQLPTAPLRRRGEESLRTLGPVPPI